MNRKVYFFLLMALSLPLAIMAQTAVVVDGDNPFSDNFEGSACEWEFVNGESVNAWYWGTATNNGGTHSVYISNDGGENNTYSHVTTWVYFTKLITLEEASYRFSYDWRCYGEGSWDHIRVGLVPGSTELTVNGGIPSGWIPLHTESYLCDNSEWSTKTYNAIITAAGNYKLVFAWKNDGGGGSNPPGAIDNVSIEELVIDNHTYLTQTTDADFIKGTGSNVNIADSRVSMQYKMASVADWAATNNLPSSMRDHQVVTWRNYVYCVGGINGSTPRNNVYRATQQDNGISGWTELNALPIALRDMGVIATQNQLVVMGGRNNDTVSDKIYSAAINDDGSIGAWQELSVTLPQPCWGLRAVEALGNIYIIGGANTDTENDATDKAYRLTLNAMGEVTGITEVNSLPEARNGHAVTVYNSKIIVTGGYDATFTQKNTVYCATVNLDGSLGTWTTQTALPNAVYGHTTICTNGILTIIGGMEGTLASNKFVYTDADATAYDWQLSDILLPERYTEGASFAFGNKIFFCGGMNISNNLNNAVRYMAVTTSDTPANHPVFVSWPFNVGTPKMMDELNYTLTNTSSYTYEILYRTADEDMVFSNWTSAGTNLPTTVNQTKSFIQYMFRVTATGEDDFAINDVTLTLSGCSQLAGNLDWIGSLTAEHSPYLVTETINFTSGTHNIGPGVTIMFMPNTGMNIGAASVNFNGTEESPILLTAYEAGIGSWNGVYYQDASDNNGITSVMEYTTIEKAGNGDNHSNLRMYYTSQPSVINHCSFNQSSVDGMYCYYTGEVPTLTNCTFDSNVRRGLFLDYNSPLTCTSCTMSNNYDGLYIYYSAPTFNDCTMTGNINCGISLAEESYNAIYTGVTCSNNLYGLYSYTPNRSFNFDESTIVFVDNDSDIAVAGGWIENNQTWNYYANGYALLGEVVVAQYYGNPKLTIVQGNTIKVQQNCYLCVGYYSYYGGMLYAVGTSEAPITFTSLNGEMGGWNGLLFGDGSDYNSSSSMRYCVVENAITNLHCEYTNQPSVMYSTFQNATDHNVYVYQASPSLEGCTLKNAPRGLSVDYNSQPTVVSTTFENHSDACVRYYSSYNTSVTYSNCTMKDSNYGIFYYTPDMDFSDNANVTFENNVYNIAMQGGTIYNTRTWGANTYAILGSVNIYGDNGIISLTLSPGATLNFAEGKQLSVDYRANLVAEGTATQPITFTSLNGEPGGWNGIRFYGGSDDFDNPFSSLKYCVIEKGNSYNLYSDGTTMPEIENCVLQNSNGYGFRINNEYCQTIKNTVIRNNASHGIYVYYNYTPFTVGGSPEFACSIYNNGGYAVYQDSYTDNNMTYNFWGNIDAEYINNNLIYDKLDDSWRGRVTFEPVSMFPVDNFEHLQGTFAYGEDKPMANSEMNIIDEEENVLATATTNGNGEYDFSNYAVGVYNTLDDDFGVDILAGVNATDALLAMRHFVHLDTLTPNYAAVADVNGNGSVNGTDAMLILRRAIDEQFPVGNFYFYSPNGISVEGNTCTYDLSFLCYGDVNGSYTPATRDNTIELMTEGQLVAESNQEIVLPVSIKNAVEMGALTLRFAYPEEYLEIEDVVLAATGESLIFSANEGALTTVWFSLEPIDLAENDELILIKVRTRDLNNIDEPVVFSLNAYSEMADGSAQVLDDVVIAMPAIVTATLGLNNNTIDVANMTVYPNPAKDVCRLSYQLAEAGHVTVTVYNMMGVKVMDAANCRQAEGKHEVRLNTSDLAAGTYCCRITFEGENSWVKTTMLIIEK